MQVKASLEDSEMAVGAIMRRKELPFLMLSRALLAMLQRAPIPAHVLLLTTPLWVHRLYQQAVFDNKAQAGTALGLGVLVEMLHTCLLKLRLLWLLRFQWDSALDVTLLLFLCSSIHGCLVASSPTE